MFLGLAPDFAVEEGSKNEPEEQVVVVLVVLVLILTADTTTHRALCEVHYQQTVITTL